MSEFQQSNESGSNPPRKSFAYVLGKFLRSEKGTFVQGVDKDGNPELKKIASHAVRVSRIVFVVCPRNVEVRYILRFHTGSRSVEVAIRHSDLNEERAFLGAAPPGFSLGNHYQSFQMMREMLMLDLNKAIHIAVLTCLGWYIWKNKPVFAHAGGVICTDSDVSGSRVDRSIGTSQPHGLIDIDEVCSDVPILIDDEVSIEEIVVEVPEQFSKYRFEQPESIEEIRSVVRESLNMLALGHANVTYLSMAAIFFAALRDPRFAVFLHGETGSLKTAFALLLLSFFVDDPQESDLASFKSTENALRARFSTSGNVPVVVDDFIEPPGRRQSSQTADKADNLIRSIVNGNGKERSKQDGGLRPNDRPRGLAIVTGETFPAALESLKHRTINIEVDATCFREAVQGTRDNDFARFQKLAAEGVFRKAMAAFLAWSTKRFDRLQEYLGRAKEGIFSNCNLHLRLPDAANDLLSGMGAFLIFAREVKAISDEEFEDHACACLDAIEEMLAKAYLESLEDSPTEAFGQLLQAVLGAHRCHIEVNDIEEHLYPDVQVPLDLLGYSEREITIPKRPDPNERVEQSDDKAEICEESGRHKETGPDEYFDEGDQTETKTFYQAHGERIGWIENDIIDLIPDVTLAVVNSLASRSGGNPFPNKKTFGKMLASKNWIAAKSKDRNTQKVRHGDTIKDVWRIHAWRLFEPAVPWGTFDVENYNEMSLVERRQLLEKIRQDRLREFRSRIARFQADALLNPHLSVEHRRELFHCDPPPADDCDADIDSRFKPQPPETRPLVGYDDPEGDGLLA